MICNTCGYPSSRCGCTTLPACGECTETIQYSGVNINLAGVGVLEELNETEFQFRGVGSGDSYIDVELNETTHVIQITLAVESLKLQQTFTDNAARASATPQYLGQLGVQINTSDIYIGTSLVAGGWTIYTP